MFYKNQCRFKPLGDMDKDIFVPNSDRLILYILVQVLFHIYRGFHSTLIKKEYNLFIFKVSKTFVFFLRTSGEYLTRYGLHKDPDFSGIRIHSIEK